MVYLEHRVLNLSHYDGESGYFFNTSSYPPGVTCPLHSHNFYELFWISRGRILHTFNGVAEAIGAGTMQMINPLDIHSFAGSVQGESILCNFAFSRGILEALVRENQLDPQNMEGKKIQLREDQQLSLGQKVQAYRKKHLAPRTFLASLLLEFYISCTLSGDQGTVEGHKIPFWLKESLHKMQEPENIKAGLPRFLKLSGKSQEYLCRCMKKYLNTTVSRWINYHRLEWSRKLLSESALSILEISYEAGFESESYYFRLFKEHFGCTPLQFRNRSR